MILLASEKKTPPYPGVGVRLLASALRFICFLGCAQRDNAMALNQTLKIKFVLVSVSVAHEVEFSPDTTIGTVKAEIIKNFAIGSGIVKIRGPNGMHTASRV